MRSLIKLRWFMFITLISLVFLLLGCTSEQPVSKFDQKVVITSISPLADIIKQVSGERIQVISLVPSGSDPHTYEPTPEAIRHVSTAKIFLPTA